MPFRFLGELYIDRFPGCSVCDVFALVDDLALNLQYKRLVIHDTANHVVCGLFSVVVADHLSAFVKGRFEEDRSELPFASLANVVGYLFPHISNENDVLEARLSTELTKHPEVSPRNSSKAIV